MKKYLLIPTMGVSLLVLGACGSESTSSSATTTNPAPDQQATLAEAAVGTLVDMYLSVKDALVLSDEAQAKAKASELVAALEQADGESVGVLVADAKALVEAQDLEDQRAHFDQLSEKMYEVVSSAEGLEKGLYKQYCPMAFNNEGAFWLSDKEEIRNPYFGDAMLTCGKVEEKIN